MVKKNFHTGTSEFYQRFIRRYNDWSQRQNSKKLKDSLQNKTDDAKNKTTKNKYYKNYRG